MNLLRKLDFLKKNSKGLPNINWQESKALALSEGLIYINKAKLNRQEYQVLVAKLKKELPKINHPQTKEQVISKAYHKDEIYTGSQVNKAPDLILVQNQGYELKAGFEERFKSPEEDQWKANHQIMGVFLAYGENVNTARKYKETFSIYDLAPTILDYYYQVKPEDFDGEVLNIFTT